MKHNRLREDVECQNCSEIVLKVYCPQCGQQNTETRQSFVNLVTHIAEDITHYDGNFRKTIKHLLVRPAKLTIEYLQGHRMRYVPPAKLYIFISFVCFFLLNTLSNRYLGIQPDAEELIEIKKDYEDFSKNGIKVEGDEFAYHSVKQLDSVQKLRPKDKKMDMLTYWDTKATLNTYDEQLGERYFNDTLMQILPKVLFIYMPIFAFWLWLLHDKKHWMFFDHGIFTLHYFSMLLVLATIGNLLHWSIDFADTGLADDIVEVVSIIAFGYSFFYFFRAHRLMYGERRAISRLKSALLFLINMISVSIVLVICVFYIMVNAH